MKTTYLALSAVLLLASCSSKPDYDATGIFEATTTTLSAETTGKLLSILPQEGDSVVAGSTVALVDTALLHLQRMQLLSQQKSAEASSPDIAAQLASLRTEIAHQQNECDRLERLKAASAATRKQCDDAQALLRSLRNQLDARLSTLSKNRSSISDNVVALDYQAAQIAEQIARAEVVTPITATVLDRYAEPGEFATPGKPLLKLADLHNIYLRSYFTPTFSHA